MKCPKCGKEIPDESLFCEFCGTEIKIVPEYEPGIEDQIDSGMETVKKSLDDTGDLAAGGTGSSKNPVVGTAFPDAGTVPEDAGSVDVPAESGVIPDDMDAEQLRREESRRQRQARYAARRRKLKFIGFLGVCMLASLAVGIGYVAFHSGREMKTQSYYVGRAYQLASEGSYQEAADEIDKAIALTDGDTAEEEAEDEAGAENTAVEAYTDDTEDQTDATLYLLKSEYLQKAGEKDLALGAASRALESSQSTEDDKIAAYGRMISIYAYSKEYEEIAELLANCSYPSVVQSYLQYTLFDPAFSVEEGVYEGTLTLELSDEGDGSIFYTLDGSRPTTSSSLYTEPIHLSQGEYIVSAVYVNHFGLESNVVVQHYTIRSTAPDAPVVQPNSGTYAKETLITVTMPQDEGEDGSGDTGGIYYTTDGTDPTEESMKYQEGLTIPAGTTTFRFVYINAEGLRSSVVERRYTYKVSTNILPADGINYILVALIKRHEVIDTVGTIPDGTAQYSFRYTGTQEIDGVRYLRYDETLVDAAGNSALTGRSYAVNAMNGTVNLYSDGTLVPIG